MANASAPASRRGPGLAGFMGVFVTLLVIEFFLDIVLFPADEFLVPAELFGDALFFSVALFGVWSGNRSNSGRQVGSRAITTTARTVRSNRRGTVGLRRSRRAALSGGQVGLIVGIWLLFAAVLGFQWWFSIHHPVLQLLTLPFEIVFDLIGVLVSIVVTVMALAGARPGAGPARQVGR